MTSIFSRRCALFFNRSIVTSASDQTDTPVANVCDYRTGATGNMLGKTIG